MMRIQIEPSKIMAEVNGFPVRVWNGITEDGIQVFLFVQAVAVPGDADSEPFARDLKELADMDVLVIRP